MFTTHSLQNNMPKGKIKFKNDHDQGRVRDHKQFIY